MAQLQAPTPRRVQDARASGLRPRSRLLVVAGLALVLAGLLGLWPLAVAWLSDQWAFDTPVSTRLPVEIPWMSGAGLGILVLGSIVVAAALGAGRRGRAVVLPARAGRELGRDAEILLVLVSFGLGVGVVVLVNAGLLAASARAVDASVAGLERVWLSWLRRGLFALAGVALGLGLVERRLSARRLWRALHQTPAQARAEARTGGRG